MSRGYRSAFIKRGEEPVRIRQKEYVSPLVNQAKTTDVYRRLALELTFESERDEDEPAVVKADRFCLIGICHWAVKGDDIAGTFFEQARMVDPTYNPWDRGIAIENPDLEGDPLWRVKSRVRDLPKNINYDRIFRRYFPSTLTLRDTRRIA